MTSNLINLIAQNKIDFNSGCKLILNEPNFDFQLIFTELRNYIFNTLPDKANYNSETYQKALDAIPLKPTYTPIAILRSFSTKIAFNKLQKLPKSEHEKIIISLIWVFKQTDTERRLTACKNGCNHAWHNI